MCTRCLTGEVNLCEGMPLEHELVHCSTGCKKWCSAGEGRAGRGHWIAAELESRALLELCLRCFMAPLKRRAKLIDGDFIWTEPHSRRVKMRIVVEAELGGSAGKLRQEVTVTFVVRSRMCPMCTRAGTGLGNWTVEVQLRQHGTAKQRTLHRLEAEIARENAQREATELSIVKGIGIDFRFPSARGAKNLIKFVQSRAPARVTTSRAKGGTAHYLSKGMTCRVIHLVDVAPICRGDLVVLPLECKLSGGQRPAACRLALCVRASAALHFVLLRSGVVGAVDAQQYRLAPFTAICSEDQLREFTVVDVDDDAIEQHRLGLVAAGGPGGLTSSRREPRAESDSASSDSGSEFDATDGAVAGGEGTPGDVSGVARRESRGRSALRASPQYVGSPPPPHPPLDAELDAELDAVLDAKRAAPGRGGAVSVADAGGDCALASKESSAAAAAPSMMEQMPARRARRSRSRARWDEELREANVEGRSKKGKDRGGGGRAKGGRGKRGKQRPGKGGGHAKGTRGARDAEEDAEWEQGGADARFAAPSRTPSRKPRRASRSASIFSSRRWGWGERRQLANGVGLGGSTVPLVDVTVLRAALDSPPLVVRSHLAPILQSGDTVLGYVVPGGEAGAVGAGSAAGLGGGNIAMPTIVLVKKKRIRTARKKKKKKTTPATAAEQTSEAAAAVATALSAAQRAGAAMPLDAVHEE